MPTPAPETTVPPTTGEMVETGDLVWIDYTGTVQSTGEVFDTTYEEVGTDTGTAKVETYPVSLIESAGPHYSPLGIIVGMGQTLSTLEDSLIGMGVGEEKTITISPTDAYGIRTDEYVVSIPRVQQAALEFSVSLDVYRQKEGKDPSIGDTVTATPYWDAVVTEVTSNAVTLQQLPEDGSIVETPYGPGMVRVEGDNVSIEVSPEVDSIIQTNIGTARVLSVSDEEIVLDYNHPLAGKTLVFDVTVRGIDKKETFAGRNISWTEYEAGLERAAAEDKPVVLYLYATWCHFCQRMNEETWPDPRVTQFDDDFVFIKEDAEVRTDLAEQYNLTAFPLIIFMDDQGKEITRINRFVNGMELRWEMDSVLEKTG